MKNKKLDLINYVNDERFSKGTLRFLIDQLNLFVDLLKGLQKETKKRKRKIFFCNHFYFIKKI